jgi:indole-3-glycerol phosphate synthase
MIQLTETGTVLDRIVTQTRLDLDARMAAVPRTQVQERIATAPAPVDLVATLDQATVTVIAEFKRASPSRGRFPVEVDPVQVASDYVNGGASAISCLTDEPFFQGSLADLESVAATVCGIDPTVGVLRKDFMIDRYQVDEARATGASCVLLIAACLGDDLMRDLNDYATSLGLSVLVEVHDAQELERALAIGARLVGINNRNLKTFAVDLDTTLRLAPLVPEGVVLVGESGIFTKEHVRTMASAGVDAILVGESLIVQKDRAAAVRALTGVEKSIRG